MSRKVRFALLGPSLVFVLALAAGCVAPAKDEFAKLRVGMTEYQVSQALGKPEEVKLVRFKGHDSDYQVWQYNMVPDIPTCPSEAIPRVMTGVATLGLAEIAWTHAKAEAHWVYFLDGAMVYTSPAFDCLNGELCRVSRSSAPQKQSRLNQ